MNRRFLVTIVLIALCIGAIWRVSVQRHDLASLKVRQQRLTAEYESAAQAEIPTARNSQPAPLHTGPPIELLELRSEVTRLKGRQRELAAARGENEQLRAQLAGKRTNSPAAPTLPPGYILKSKAQWKGLNTPEDTLQSFLWAANNRDLTNLLQTLAPESARQVLAATQQQPAGEDFLKELGAIPGMQVISRTQESNSQVSLKVEFVPGMPDSFRFRQINGQWKLDMR